MIYPSNQFIGTKSISIHQISRCIPDVFFLPCQDVSYKFGGVGSPAFYDTLMWRFSAPACGVSTPVESACWYLSLIKHAHVYCLAVSGWGEPNSYLYLAEFISIFSSDAFSFPYIPALFGHFGCIFSRILFSLGSLLPQWYQQWLFLLCCVQMSDPRYSKWKLWLWVFMSCLKDLRECMA